MSNELLSDVIVST